MKPLMSHSFRMTENEETFKLAEPINTTNKEAWISLKNVYIDVGVFNIKRNTNIRWFELGKDGSQQNREIRWIDPGRYVIDYFKDFLNDLEWLTIDIDHIESKITITNNSDSHYLVLDSTIQKLLGISYSELARGEHAGYYKNVERVYHLCCEQLSKENNFYNGNPCCLLAIIPIVGKNNYDFNPFFNFKLELQLKQLVNDRINELTFSLRDCEGKMINNRGREIILDVEIY